MRKKSDKAAALEAEIRTMAEALARGLVEVIRASLAEEVSEAVGAPRRKRPGPKPLPRKRGRKRRP